jgi:hypothetical protein
VQVWSSEAVVDGEVKVKEDAVPTDRERGRTDVRLGPRDQEAG